MAKNTKESNKINLYHGSVKIIEEPQFGKGNPKNDYGLGFYCTMNLDLSKEWACYDKNGGFANVYILDLSSFSIMDLTNEKYSILEWLALLVNNRELGTLNPVAAEAKKYLTVNFLPAAEKFDIIKGYRADDSYFSFAMDFLNNTISLRQLNHAMSLGSLGEQIMLKSKKSFDALEYVRSEPVNGEIYYKKREKRDNDAREQYFKKEPYSAHITDDIFMIDVLRQRMKQGDTRLQRNLS